jgi:hypothetical protein
MLGPVGLFILWAVLATAWSVVALVAALLVKLCSSEVQMTTQRIPAAEGMPARTVHGFYRWWGNLAGIGVGLLTLVFALSVGARMTEWLLLEISVHWRGLVLLALLAAGVLAGLVHARKLDLRKFGRDAPKAAPTTPETPAGPPSGPPVAEIAAAPVAPPVAPPATRYRPTAQDLAAVPPVPQTYAPAPVVGWSLEPGAPHWASREG